MRQAADRLARLLADGAGEAVRSPIDAEFPIPEWAFQLADIAIAAQAQGGRDALARTFASGVGHVAALTDHVSVVATGMNWLGGGVAGVERTMADLIAGARREVILTAYSVTSGSERIWDEVARALATGVMCTIVIDRLREQEVGIQAFLDRLAAAHPRNLRLFDFSCDDARGGLHAKVLVVDRATAVVGSANLSHRGLVGAHELAIVVRGPTAEVVAEQVDRLLRGGDARPIN